MSAGFALVTAAFAAHLTVPSIEQSQAEGYKYPKRIAIHTQPQDGWVETANRPFDATLTVGSQAQLYQYRVTTRSKYLREPVTQQAWIGALPALWSAADQTTVDRVNARRGLRHADQPDTAWFYATQQAWTPDLFPRVIDQRTPARALWRSQTDQDQSWLRAIPFVISFDERSRDRYKKTPQLDQPQDGWLYTALPILDIWSAEKFQNGIGEFAPVRKAMVFRYPLLTTGFSTDRSSAPLTDTWSAEKFQPAVSDRLASRKVRDFRLDYHKFAFGLLDARPIMPAIEQLGDSYRSERKRTLNVRQLPVIDTAWIYTILPYPFDPQLLPHASHDRLRDRYKKIPQLDQPSQDWITLNTPPFDAQFFIQGQEPFRSHPVTRLELSLYEFAYAMPWVHDVIPLTDPLLEQEPTVILVGGDDAPSRKKPKTRKERRDLFREIESTIHALLHPAMDVVDSGEVSAIPSDSAEIGAARRSVDELLVLAKGQRDLLQRAAALRAELRELEAVRNRMLEQDEEEALEWMF